MNNNTIEVQIINKTDNSKPIYAFSGIKRNNLIDWLSYMALGWLGNLIWREKTYFVIIFPAFIRFSERGFFNSLKEIKSFTYSLSELKQINVKKGIILDSVQLVFSNGFTILLRDILKEQLEPINRLLQEGLIVFDTNKLSQKQLDECQKIFDLLKLS